MGEDEYIELTANEGPLEQQTIEIDSADNNEVEVSRESIIYADVPEERIANIENRVTILESDSGNKVTLGVDSNYVMVLQLLNKNDEVISTASIDFPIESMVVNASYSNGVLTLTLQNGNTLDVDISDIVDGLVNESDLANYVKNTDYATGSKGGVFKTASAFNTAVSSSSGILYGLVSTYTQYQNKDDGTFISKGTLENVITGKELINQTTLDESQAEQNTDIQANTDNITALQEKIDYIEGLIPTGEAIGESLTLSNTARYPFKEFNVGGNTKQATAILPDEYQQVDYIESSGTQYINTGYVPNGNTKYDLDFIPTLMQLSSVHYIITAHGWVNGSGCRNNIGIVRANNAISAGYGTIYKVYNTIVEANKKYKFVLDKNKFYINNDLIDTFEAQNFNNNVTTCIFCQHELKSDGTEGIANYATGKLYTCKIYDNDTLVRDFIPCYRKSDNVVGLYDLVNKVFYTNAGTGAFTYGAAVTIPNPSYPQEIENVSGEVEVKVANSFANYKYTTEKTSNWTANQTIFQYDKINSNKMLAIVYTNIQTAGSPSLTLRGLIGGSYSGNTKELTAIKIDNKWCFYGYLTPTATETRYWITNGASVFTNIYSKLCVYDASEFEISDEDLLKFMANPVDVYEEQTATFPLAEGQVLHLGDTLENDGIHQRRFTKIFNGNEELNAHATITGLFNNVISYKKSNTYSSFMTHFIHSESGPSGLNTGEFCTRGGTGKQVWIKTEYSSIADFKAFLVQQYTNGTPVTLEDELEQEIIIPYTAEQQTAYNNLKNLYSYKGTTYISSSNEPSPVFEVVYRKDLSISESRLEALEARVALLE